MSFIFAIRRTRSRVGTRRPRARDFYFERPARASLGRRALELELELALASGAFAGRPTIAKMKLAYTSVKTRTLVYVGVHTTREFAVRSLRKTHGRLSLLVFLSGGG